MYITKLKKSIRKGYIDMILTLAHSGKGKTRETVKRAIVARGGGGGERDGWNTGIFRTGELLCMILWPRIHVIIYLSKPTERRTLSLNLNVNYEFGVITMCVNVGSTAVTNIPVRWWMLTVGKTVHEWGQLDTWEISVRFTQFFCEPKTALQKKVY